MPISAPLMGALPLVSQQALRRASPGVCAGARRRPAPFWRHRGAAVRVVLAVWRAEAVTLGGDVPGGSEALVHWGLGVLWPELGRGLLAPRQRLSSVCL